MGAMCCLDSADAANGFEVNDPDDEEETFGVDLESSDETSLQTIEYTWLSKSGGEETGFGEYEEF